MKWSEEELKALEIGVVGGFARGCHAGGVAQFALLSAVGSTAKSRIRYARVMGLKEETVQGVGFKSLAIFRRELSQAMLTRRAMLPGWGVSFRDRGERLSRMISGALLPLNSSVARPPMASCISKMQR